MGKPKMIGAMNESNMAGLNREQRRFLAKHKNHGENYADVLRRQKIEDAAINQEVSSTVIMNGQEDAVQRYLWLSCVAMNEAFGFGASRWAKYMEKMDEISMQFTEECDSNGYDVAMAHLANRVKMITGKDVERRDDYRKKEWWCDCLDVIMTGGLSSRRPCQNRETNT